MAQHENKIKIVGKVVNIETRSGTNKNNQEYIGGKMYVDTGDGENDNIIPVDFYANKFKNDGGANGIYNSLQTVVNEFKTIKNNGEDEADLVEVNGGNLSENAFYTKDGTLIRGFQIQAPFFNRKVGEDHEGTFTVTGEILKVVEEIGQDDVPTGKLKVSLLVLGYNDTANVIDFKVIGEKGVEYAKTNFQEGMEVKVNGNILINEEFFEKREETAFGEPIVEQFRKVERELVITKATAPEESSIPEDLKNKSLAARQSTLEKKKKEAEGKGKKDNKPAGKANFTI